jgi:hypothetical protein
MKLLIAVTASVALITSAAALAHGTQKNEAAAKIALKASTASSSEVLSPQPHSGGTDSKGCHTNHKTGDYHCHKPKS